VAIVVATTLYPMRAAWLAAFGEALAQLLARADSEAVVALDGIDERAARAAMPALADAQRVRFFAANGTPSAIRMAMLRAARERNPAAVVLVDADDVPSPDALETHCGALAHADISYGDMALVDEDGAALGRLFFAGADIPARVAGSAHLSRVNFMGLTNTALAAPPLAAFDRASPGADIAAFDWWLFTSLLDAGFVAARTARPVTQYRHRRDATLGAVADADPQAFVRRCRMVAAQARAFPDKAALRAYGSAAGRLADDVAREPGRYEAAIAAACAAPGVWFSDVDRMVGAAA